jgi:hypothetical protein
MPQKVKNYVFINYEYIKEEPFEFLESIRVKFNLKKKGADYKSVEYYKMVKSVKYVEHPITLPPYVISFIIQNIDKEQEKRLNYKV